MHNSREYHFQTEQGKCSTWNDKACWIYQRGLSPIALSQIGFLGETDSEMGIGMQDAY